MFYLVEKNRFPLISFMHNFCFALGSDKQTLATEIAHCV